MLNPRNSNKVVKTYPKAIKCGIYFNNIKKDL